MLNPAAPAEKTTSYSADRTTEPASKSPDAAEGKAPVTPPASTSSATAATGSSGKLSVSAIVGFVLSGLGFFLITVPFGIWLGYRGRSETADDRLEGGPFARWAIVLGWLWVAFWLLALLSYLWILL
ncbi:DUF4190 domain-containing protein [Gordonia alkaliphila]|uniref:DUF4190 domain-containing protein n=1 Tax=Gordonia alkaliphila TaxID=1053547 RepID=UPI001FF2BE39|nr:DUF4190 domain-containing protein [Gordonia alkaliphila]MCK0439036.1 DUF4190 domain-containing protein [Gordonia alkaliphila]